MGKGYKQLTDAEREQIERWLGEGIKQGEIAKRLGRNPGTISREVRRGWCARGGGYVGAQLHHKAMRRRHIHGRKLTRFLDVWATVQEHLRWG